MPAYHDPQRRHRLLNRVCVTRNTESEVRVGLRVGNDDYEIEREMNGWWKEILGVEEHWEWDWGRLGKVWYRHLYGEVERLCVRSDSAG